MNFELCQNDGVDFVLHPVETRVLGSLLEKDVTTPEYYPLTVNALVNACNQKSNRDPVVAYDEGTVEVALETLGAKGLVSVVTGGSNRVPKHAHRFAERLNLGRRELAILCELMLRGPQTVGELRGRCARMYEFSDTDAVESCLRSMMERQPDPLVVRLPHLAGTKEPRYAHLLSGEPDMVIEAPGSSHATPESPGGRTTDRISALEAEVASMREEMADLKRRLEDFRRQFE